MTEVENSGPMKISRATQADKDDTKKTLAEVKAVQRIEDNEVFIITFLPAALQNVSQHSSLIESESRKIFNRLIF